MSEDRSPKAERETLSALMDGEVSEIELHRALRELESDVELRQCWRRYQLASSVMRRDFSGLAIDVSRQVTESLANDPPPRQGHKAQAVIRGFGRSVGRLAIAASVAAVAVLGVQQMRGSGVSESGVQQARNMAAVVDTENVDSIMSEPRFQSPSGFETPLVSARTVSNGSFNRVSQEPEFNLRYQTLETELQVRAYMQRLMRQAEARAWASRVYAAPSAVTAEQTVSRDEER